MTKPDISPLHQRLAERIRDNGPITFAEFMEAALYDPAGGFYARPPVGEDGHFVTSPHVSPAFGDLVARQVAECWDLLGRPHPFGVVELGAGDGTLARQVEDASRSVPELDAALRVTCIERTAGQAEVLRQRGMTVAGSPSEAAPVHVLVANEVLDNVPFHRLRERDGAVVEVRVGVDGDGLAEVETEPGPDAVAALDRPLRPGEERPVSPAALA
ncbi:MAG: SAM-dependent methyltransferase, partial [Actinomycetota bacterium]